MNGGTWDLGVSNGQSITVSKSCSVSTFPIPFTDSNCTLGFDVSGIKREINYTGVVTADSRDSIQRFIQAMNSLVNGQQNEQDIILTYDFNKSWNGTDFSDAPIKVMVTGFTYTYSAAQENQLQYNLMLAEANPNADGAYGDQYNPITTIILT
jgi:hypothetical protein